MPITSGGPAEKGVKFGSIYRNGSSQLFSTAARYLIAHGIRVFRLRCQNQNPTPGCYARPVMLHIAARPCAQALAPFVASFHYHEGELAATVERILPTGQVHLMVNLDEDEFRTYSGLDCATVHRTDGAVLAGPHGRSTAIDTREQRRLIAVEFKLGGAAAFLRMPISEACDQVVELDNVWGGDGGLLRERLCEVPTPIAKFRVLEAVLRKRLVRPWDPAIAAAISLLDSGASVAEARSRVGLLPKTFVRRFREQVGLAPKRFSRVRRLQSIVGAVRRPADVDWCMVAAEHGYTDQAHFIHDFRDLTGITPTAYCPPSPQRRNHVPLTAPAK
ncbi:MAG TPA: AraC family transcriptional regulator [Bryobacteraceae bacterium]|jgi:AraC-like DNA-binding protein|nr:AraC family transcriptional regulator [Bryobacteraceae bacterium]